MIDELLRFVGREPSHRSLLSHSIDSDSFLHSFYRAIYIPSRSRTKGSKEGSEERNVLMKFA